MKNVMTGAAPALSAQHEAILKNLNLVTDLNQITEDAGYTEETSQELCTDKSLKSFNNNKTTVYSVI